MKVAVGKLDEASDGSQVGFYIPISSDEFGNLLVGLLKTPRTVHSYIEGYFWIDKDQISKIHYMLTQRISEQHQSALIEFSAQIFYDDGRSIEVGDFEDLQNYAEITKSRAVALDVEWSFLIVLPGSDVPQKQEVTLSFRVGRKSARGSLSPSFEFSEIFRGRRSVTLVRIRHTHVTLGHDLINMLSAELNQVRDDRFISKFFRHQKTQFALSFFSILAIGSIFFVALFEGLYPDDSSLNISNYNELVQQVLRANVAVAISFLLGVSLAVLSAMVSVQFSEKERPSFIVFSEGARDRALVELKKYNHRMSARIYAAAGTLVVGIVGSLIASGVWEKISGWF